VKDTKAGNIYDKMDKNEIILLPYQLKALTKQVGEVEKPTEVVKMMVARLAATLRQNLLRPRPLRLQPDQIRKLFVSESSSGRSVSYNMKELLVRAGPKVTVINSPIPTANEDQVVIKVVAVGSNPKDWKRPEWRGNNINQGDDVAGFVHAVGANVTEFKVREPFG